MTMHVRQTRPATPVPAHVAPSLGGGDLVQAMALMGARMSFPRNAEIYGEGEPADFVYQVVSGAVRTSKILSDGRPS